MTKRPFSTQLIIIGGFILFFYGFFALTTSIYRDYKLEGQIQKFQADIDKLADLAHRKPEDVAYFDSLEYKDRYAKENLNLLNPGEKVIIIPSVDQIVRKGPSILTAVPPVSVAVLGMPHPRQWWEYFFGPTLSVTIPGKNQKPDSAPAAEEPAPLPVPVPAPGQNPENKNKEPSEPIDS
jgi:cell division protein FtsB